MYCEYCFNDNIKTWVENSIGAIFCDDHCADRMNKELYADNYEIVKRKGVNK